MFSFLKLIAEEMKKRINSYKEENLLDKIYYVNVVSKLTLILHIKFKYKKKFINLIHFKFLL